MIVRTETAADIPAIATVVERAFAQQPQGSGHEAAIVAALRAAGALVLSLVLVLERQVVGHVAFSAVRISDGSSGWHGLGPLSVLPDRQHRRLGSMLVRVGLARLRELGAAGCVVLGDPDYYPRFGFQLVPGLVFPGAPPQYFMALAFEEPLPQGTVAYHPAFAGSGPAA